MTTRLETLEDRSVWLLREAQENVGRLGMLWSAGKDSNVLLWLARKAFLGHIPFPVIHIDTGYKPAELIDFRDELARDWNLDLIVGSNQTSRDEGWGPERGRLACCKELKSEGLRQTTEKLGLNGLIVGIRRDEEGSRGKERTVSPRGRSQEYDVATQPPEFWDQFAWPHHPADQVRVHPLLEWTELDIWHYAAREGLPLCPLYFAREGRRYRSLGCAPCNSTIKSSATTINEIIAELETTSASERAGRAQDKESPYALQQLRRHGYM